MIPKIGFTTNVEPRNSLGRPPLGARPVALRDLVTSAALAYQRGNAGDGELARGSWRPVSFIFWRSHCGRGGNRVGGRATNGSVWVIVRFAAWSCLDVLGALGHQDGTNSQIKL